MLMDTPDKAAPVNNFGTIQTERNARGTARPYDPAERHYGPGDAPAKRQHQSEPVEVFDGPIPGKWTAKHVGRRLVDAFNVLHRLPRLPAPKEPGGNWVSYSYSRDDLSGWFADDDKAEHLLRTVLKPTRQEITRMEAAFEWLANLRRHDPGMALQLMFWSSRAAQRRSIKKLCIEQKWCPGVFHRRINRGKDWIAKWLNGRREPVY